MDSTMKNNANGAENSIATATTSSVPSSSIIGTSNSGSTISTNNLNNTFNQQHSLSENIFRNQPIMCPWITVQPYPSTAHINNNSLNHKTRFNNAGGNCFNNTCGSNNWSGNGKACGNNPSSVASMQYSNTCFFYFLRMMQLFPDVHPATLHTVLTICKNDFFSAVDKILYAKRCKTINNKRVQRRSQCAPYPSKSNLSAKDLKHTPIVIVNNNSVHNATTIGSIAPGNANVMVEAQPQMQILHQTEDQNQKDHFDELCGGSNIVDINHVDINVPTEGTLIEMPENILDEKELVFAESSTGISSVNRNVEKVIVENPEDLSSTVVITTAI